MKNRKISAMKNTVSSSMTGNGQTYVTTVAIEPFVALIKDIRTKLNTARDGLRLRRQ